MNDPINGANGKTANENVLRALARAIAAARAGNVATVAVITVTPEGAPDCALAGDSDYVPSINIGADMLKSLVLAQVMSTTKLPTTPLVRPATGSGLDS